MIIVGTKIKNTGSILLYVLWILVVISLLSFKLSSASRVVMIKQVSEVSQIKKDLQLNSAIKFATFKILKNDWKNIQFKQNLNNQRITIDIYNESGFISLYDLSSQSLENVFESADFDSSSLNDLKNRTDSKKLHFNDFSELTQFEGVSAENVQHIIPYVSIYHQEGVNPAHSPENVLMKIKGVDQYRVKKLIDSSDMDEKREIRNEIVDILRSKNVNMTEDENDYYRIHISLDSRLYRVFVKLNRRSQDFVVVNIISPVDFEV